MYKKRYTFVMTGNSSFNGIKLGGGTMVEVELDNGMFMLLEFKSLEDAQRELPPVAHELTNRKIVAIREAPKDV